MKNQINILKGIGILLVVFRHTCSQWPDFNAVMSLFRMPLFFFVSGYLYKNRHTLGPYFEKKFKGLLMPWITAYVVMHLIDKLPRLLGFDYDFFLGYGVGGALSAMWFIPVLFVVQLAFHFNSERGHVKISPTWQILILALVPYVLVYFQGLANDGRIPGATFLAQCSYAGAFYVAGFSFRSMKLEASRNLMLTISLLVAVPGTLLCLLLPAAGVNMAVGEFGIPIVSLIIGLAFIYLAYIFSEAISGSRILGGGLAYIGISSFVIFYLHQPLNIFLVSRFRNIDQLLLFALCIGIPILIRAAWKVFRSRKSETA